VWKKHRQAPERRVVVVERRPDRPAEAVDGVVATPEDAVVGREAVVVELVRAVRQPLAPAPADRVAVGGVEPLGYEHVVVDGQDVAADGSQERRERARAEQHPARADRALARADLDRADAARGERLRAGVLVHAHAEPLRGDA
jgi:hypothetical protein